MLASLQAFAERQPRPARLLLAFGLGLLVFGLSFYWQSTGNLGDLDQVLVGARAMAQGRDPYAVVGPGREFQWLWRLYYPGTAMAMVLPLTLLPAVLARALFVGVSAGLLAYAITDRGWYLLPLLMSAPFVGSLQAVQWTPLLTAAWGLPALAWVWVAKPNFAVPFLLARPSRRAILALLLGGGLIFGISLLLDPGWPARWLPIARHAAFLRPPVAALLGGPLLLLALLRWRRPEARLLFGLACVPQTIALYNTLPLLLVCRRRLETMVLALLSWVVTGLQVWLVDLPRPLEWRYQAVMGANVLLLYLPALWIVLRSPGTPVAEVAHDAPSRASGEEAGKEMAAGATSPGSGHGA